MPVTRSTSEDHIRKGGLGVPKLRPRLTALHRCADVPGCDPARGADDAGAERDEAGHDEGEDGVERDVLSVDDPVEDEPEQAARGPGRGCEPCVAVPHADGDPVGDRAEQRDGEKPLVAERAEDDRVDGRDSASSMPDRLDVMELDMSATLWIARSCAIAVRLILIRRRAEVAFIPEADRTAAIG